MAHGKTLWLIGFSKSIAEREQPERKPRRRDRSLRNKDRILMRRFWRHQAKIGGEEWES